MPQIPSLLREASKATFEESPRGRYVRGERWAYYGLSDALFGYALYGRIRRTDIAELADFMRGEFRRAPHEVLTHLAYFDAAEPEAFEGLANFVNEHRQALAACVTRAAIVRPTGMSGALASGFFDVIEAPFPVDVFDGTLDALKALGVAQHAELATTLDESVAEWHGTPTTVALLRSYLSSDLLNPTITAAAKALSMSTRTLQRKLAAEGTRFQQEVMRARLDAAERMLTETELPISAIAFDLGFSSPQHLSRAFRTTFGLAPRDFRARRQRL